MDFGTGGKLYSDVAFISYLLQSLQSYLFNSLVIETVGGLCYMMIHIVTWALFNGFFYYR